MVKKQIANKNQYFNPIFFQSESLPQKYVKHPIDRNRDLSYTALTVVQLLIQGFQGANRNTI